MALDLILKNQKQVASEPLIGLASAKDRLASHILDVILILPFIQLLQAPVKRWILESYLFDKAAWVNSLYLLNIFLFISLFLIYHTLMIWKKGQTLGKMFFGIKVISYQGEIQLTHGFLRALTLFFELVSLGIPLTSILSHPLRRPLHDRVADTLVITERNPSGFPSSREKWQARLMAYGLVLLLMVLSFMSWLLVEIILPSDLMAQKLKNAIVALLTLNPTSKNSLNLILWGKLTINVFT